MSTQQAFKYIREHRKDLLKFIEHKGLSSHDSEDQLQEAAIDVTQYYNTDMAKSVHLAVERQLSKYYKGHGNVAKRPLQEIRYFEQCYEDMMEDRTEGRDPLDILTIEDLKEKIPNLIDQFAASQPQREFLYLVYVDNLSVAVAADMAGFTSRNGRKINKRFLEFMGE